MMNGIGFGGMGLGWLFWVGIIGLAIWAVTKLAGGGLQTASQKSMDALSILNTRFARGEISREEYEQMKRALR